MSNNKILPNVVLAHQWLVSDRGAEVVLRELMRLFPEAPIACLVKSKDFNPPWLRGREIIESPLARIPRSAKYYKHLLALHPWAIRKLKVPAETRFVLSADAAMIKGLSLPAGIPQVCYCHSPPRYLWDQMENYRQTGGLFASATNLVFSISAKSCRTFDKNSAANVSDFIANSRFVSDRIRTIYGRESTVIFPPVNVEDFKVGRNHDDYYLIVSQLVPYKRIDLAVEACSRIGRKLVVVGEGPEMARLKSLAGPSITFRGRLSRSDVESVVERCRAFLYPQVEDFGITAVEAQAAGKPVIAYGKGGALETVIDGQTGVFFDEQTVDSLAAAIRRFESIETDWTGRTRANAELFKPERFREEVKNFLIKTHPKFFTDHTWPI